jgi:glycogen operon protein
LFTRYVRGIGGAVTARGMSDHQASIAAATGFSDLFNRPTTPPLAANSRAPRARTDIYPTHTVAGFGVRPGVPLPLGATAHSHGVNFAVYSRHATGCTLVLYESAAPAPFAEIPFPDEFRSGDVFAMLVFNLNPEDFEYGFRVEGPWDPRHGHRFDRRRVLLDPAARAISWRSAWGRRNGDVGTPRARMVAEDFDWEGDRPLQLPLEELVIYELHVRGFTRHPSSGTQFPGAYAGLREKIPYLLELGVNCVELLPVCEFDETEVERANPATGERLLNYWGYSTLGFYAPKATYAASGAYRLQADEFKTLVKSLHRAGIEIILDVVFNHTSEGNENGPTLSFRAIRTSAVAATRSTATIPRCATTY